MISNATRLLLHRLYTNLTLSGMRTRSQTESFSPEARTRMQLFHSIQILRSSNWQHQVDHKYRHHDNCRHASFPSLLYFSRAVKRKRKQGLVTGSTPFVVYFSSLQGISSCPVSSLSCRKTLKHFYILDAFHVPIHFVTDRLHANVVRLMRQTRSIRTVYRIRVQE